MERTRTHNLAVGSVCKLRAETLPIQPPRHRCLSPCYCFEVGKPDEMIKLADSTADARSTAAVAAWFDLCAMKQTIRRTSVKDPQLIESVNFFRLVHLQSVLFVKHNCGMVCDWIVNERRMSWACDTTVLNLTCVTSSNAMNFVLNYFCHRF